MANPKPFHIPVMVSEVVEALHIKKAGQVLVDCTMGYGGHSEALTRSFGSEDCLVGMDRDARAIAHCRDRFSASPFALHLYHGPFREIEPALEAFEICEVDAVLFDCGFSSPQIDTSERGFSFQHDGPLDMRMDNRSPLTAADLVNQRDADELTLMFKRYGDERFARRIARAIVRRRAVQPVETTQELADLILSAIPAANRHKEGIHPATRVFQALRIAVNEELDELRGGLRGALNRLAEGGRVAVLSYHSLEHRIVKEEFREFCGQPGWVPGPEQYAKQQSPRGRLLSRKAMTPCSAELADNPRSRSAQLRVVERLAEGDR